MGGGAVQQPHHPTPEDPANSRLPHVLMDYFFMGQDDNKVLPMLGLKERQCKMKFAHMVEEKAQMSPPSSRYARTSTRWGSVV